MRSPRLHRAAQELSGFGVSLTAAVDVMATLKRHSEAIAEKYVELFLEHLWRPFEEAGEPLEQLARVRDALERLRPLAGESVLAVFQVVMTDAVEAAIEREVTRLGERAERSASRPPRGRRRSSPRAARRGSPT